MRYFRAFEKSRTTGTGGRRPTAIKQAKRIDLKIFENNKFRTLKQLFCFILIFHQLLEMGKDDDMDRTCRGLVAGAVAGIAMNIWNLTDYYLFHITEIRFLDWAAVLLTWSRPPAAFQGVISLFVQLIWDAFLGAIFAHLLVLITSRELMIKSTLYSMILWFFFKIVVNFYRVPVLSGKQPFPGLLSNLAAIILWGIVLGLVLEKLNKTSEE
ncbi:hypothetical protein [Candidatus Formimonas warabiya]|uniref:Uncharacterized protein n=1 Tax=Formimonas warabiya TaxID=1761012 RepID=A0A3G1KXS2_FORW1|nr:hypothetical protein [Candidatus Formimonas warabiya]ATW27241.1 hypothetical protein DCMF_23010 [Candidatus Formimonas warabiya]